MPTIVTCRNCGTRLRVADDASSGGACPQCFTALDESGAVPVIRAPNLLRDVSRDAKGSSIGLCVLGGLLLVGTILFLASGGMQLVTSSPEGPVVFGFTLLVLAAVVIGIGCLMYFTKDVTAKAVGGALGGVAAGMTIALGFVLLVIFAICAGISNFLDTCSKGISPH